MMMFSWRKPIVGPPPNPPPKALTLSASDDLHSRVWNAMRYAGFPNPNDHGIVDSIVYVLGEYAKLDAEALRCGGAP